MQYILAPLVAWSIAQVIKTIIFWIQQKKFDISLLVASGGMPSSHSALVVALTMKIALICGLDSPFFAISLVFSLVVMYDAINVRQSVGKQAIVLNRILKEYSKTGVLDDEQVKVILGHTPLQVLMGLLLGLVCGYFVP